MKKNTVEFLFLLLKSAILGKKLTDSEKSGFSPETLSEMKAISDKHDITHLLAFALDENNMSFENDTELEFSIIKALFRYESSSFDFLNICKAFEENKISFIPLKGLILRDFYPEGWMRTSCDIDILVHKEDLEKAASVLTGKCDYTYYSKTSHDISFVSPNKTHIELHFDLIEDDRIKKSADVMKSVWETSTIREGCNYCYEMTDEMFYFYHVAHMAKHFENGGCGIRPFLDFLLLNKRDNIDFSKREMLLKQGELFEFYKSVTRLCEIWFCDRKMDYASQCMEAFIICGGTYGTDINNAKVKTALGESKINYFFKIMFLHREALAEQYPNLKKHPSLFAFYQVKRWLGIFDKEKREKVQRLTRVKNSVTKNDVNTTVELLELIGLTENK